MKVVPVRLQPGAFTLVETILAIGILSVALLGIGTALVTALSASNENDRDTLIVSMSEQILSELRLVPFDALGAASPLDQLRPVAVLTNSSLLQDSVYYFNADGQPVQGERVQAEGAYRCTVKKKPLKVDAFPAAETERCELLQLTLLFQRPVSAVEKAVTTRIISARLARR